MDYDFTGVEPLRLHEARRRVAAIEAYLQIRSPTGQDTLDAARSIGLNQPQFSRLVRIWRAHHDVSRLVSGRRGPPKRDYGLDPRGMEILAKAINNAGDKAELASISTAVERACKRAGVRPPSKATMWKRIRAARAAGALQISPEPLIIMGRMWFHFPIAGRSKEEMPCLLAAVALPERHIIYHEISTELSQPPSIAKAVEMLLASRTAEAPNRRLLLDPYDCGAASAVLHHAGLSAVKPHKRSVQRMFTKALGGELGSLNGIFRRENARPTHRQLLRQDQPLTEVEVHNIIEAAIERHNGVFLSDMPPFDIENG